MSQPPLHWSSSGPRTPYWKIIFGAGGGGGSDWFFHSGSHIMCKQFDDVASQNIIMPKYERIICTVICCCRFAKTSLCQGFLFRPKILGGEGGKAAKG